MLVVADILKSKAGDLMSGKKLFLILGLMTLLITTGSFLWLWWTDEPPKAPLRSRSVQIELVRPDKLV